MKCKMLLAFIILTSFLAISIGIEPSEAQNPLPCQYAYRACPTWGPPGYSSCCVGQTPSADMCSPGNVKSVLDVTDLEHGDFCNLLTDITNGVCTPVVARCGGNTVATGCNSVHCPSE